MSLHKPQAADEFSGNKSSDLIGETVLLSRRGEIGTMETSNGRSEYVRVLALIVTDSGDVRNLGELPIFWSAVRNQLLRDCPDGEWIGGQVERAEGKQYYILQTPTDQAWQNLASVVEHIDAGNVLPPVEETDEDLDPDSAPF